jgi:hypothetical protein
MQYLLGIREQETNHVQGMQHTKDRESMNREHDRTTQEGQAITTQQLSQISESDTSGSDNDISSESSLLHLRSSAWVDAGSGELTLLRWTQGFASILRQPSPECAGFLNWLVEEQRQGFSAWLQAAVAERTWSTRTITLQIPRQRGDNQGRGKLCKRIFTCMVLEVAEELPETLQLPTVKVARLDFQEQKRKKNTLRSQPPRQSRDVLLWVEMPSKRILKSQNAPRMMFQAGSCLLVVQETARFLSRVDVEMTLDHIGMAEPMSSILGSYTVASGGYQLHTEIALLRCGERWQDTDRSWCLLSLSKVQLSYIKSEETVTL